MTKHEIFNRLRYLNRQLSYLDGETPLNDHDREMIRERNQLRTVLFNRRVHG